MDDDCYIIEGLFRMDENVNDIFAITSHNQIIVGYKQ